MASMPFSHPPHLTGCQALAALRPLPLSPAAQGIALLKWLYAILPFSQKRVWLPEAIRHRLSALPGEQRMLIL